jgi:hypothetical protein
MNGWTKLGYYIKWKCHDETPEEILCTYKRDSKDYKNIMKYRSHQGEVMHKQVGKLGTWIGLMYTLFKNEYGNLKLTETSIRKE